MVTLEDTEKERQEILLGALGCLDLCIYCIKDQTRESLQNL